jgi:hypothetical protein
MGFACSALLAALLLARPAVIVHAQAPAIESGSMVQMLTVRVKPSFETEYEEYRTKLLMALDKANVPGSFLAYVVTSGGQQATYVYLRHFATFTQMDGIPGNTDVLRSAFGIAEATRLAKLRSGVDSVETQVFRERPWLSTKPQIFSVPKAFMQMVRTHVKAEMSPTYQWFLLGLKNAQDKIAAQPPVIRLESVDGTAFTNLALQYFDTYAERDTWPANADTLRVTYDDVQATKLQDAQAQSIVRRETWWLRYRRDLSRPPRPITSSR